jgi:hypothetical protein
MVFPSFSALSLFFFSTLTSTSTKKNLKSSDPRHPAAGQAPRARRHQGQAHRARGAAVGQGREARVRVSCEGPFSPGGARGAGEFLRGVLLSFFEGGSVDLAKGCALSGTGMDGLFFALLCAGREHGRGKSGGERKWKVDYFSF